MSGKIEGTRFPQGALPLNPKNENARNGSTVGANSVGGAAQPGQVVGGADKKPTRDSRIDEVAKLYEKQFLREMVKAMRSTVNESELMPTSMGEKIYRGQLDEQYVETWGDMGGIGLGDLIYEQLMDKFGAGRTQSMKPQGPIALSSRDVVRVSRQRSPSPQEVPMRIELKPQAPGEKAMLNAPWSGRLLSQGQLENGSTAVVLEHDAGLRSTFIFRGGHISQNAVGSHVEKGAPLGTLSPESDSLFWKVQGSLSPAEREQLRADIQKTKL